jgi:hypothetical protein
LTISLFFSQEHPMSDGDHYKDPCRLRHGTHNLLHAIIHEDSIHCSIPGACDSLEKVRSIAFLSGV